MAKLQQPVVMDKLSSSARRFSIPIERPLTNVTRSAMKSVFKVRKAKRLIYDEELDHNHGAQLMRRR
jgi:hypothetical protein